MENKLIYKYCAWTQPRKPDDDNDDEDVDEDKDNIEGT